VTGKYRSELVDQTSASWNQLSAWLSRMAALRQVAWCSTRRGLRFVGLARDWRWAVIVNELSVYVVDDHQTSRSNSKLLSQPGLDDDFQELAVVRRSLRRRRKDSAETTSALMPHPGTSTGLTQAVQQLRAGSSDRPRTRTNDVARGGLV